MILILAVSGFASTSAGRSVEPLVGVIARDLASDPRTVALLATAFALPYAFIQPILGPIADALGKERIFPDLPRHARGRDGALRRRADDRGCSLRCGSSPAWRPAA